MYSVWCRWHLIYLILFYSLLLVDFGDSESLRDVYTKECEGTHTGLMYNLISSERRYESYRLKYENCTRVRSNLEIVYIELTDEKYDFSFLENIREVGGYVLIHGNYVRRIRLTRLRVIRGIVKYKSEGADGKDQEFSLHVSKNSKPHNDSIGLQELLMPSLVAILSGNVLFMGNARLCFGEKTIDWTRIVSNYNPEKVSLLDEFGHEKIDCQSVGVCHENCTAAHGRRYCWGPDGDNCQQLNGKCDSECIAGCDRPNQCLSCRKYARLSEKPECIENCSKEVLTQTPSGNRYKQPDDKYSQGSKCVSKCEAGFVLQGYNCVENCEAGYMVNSTKCVPCPGKCPETCDGIETEWILRRDLPRLRGCKILIGNLIISDSAFSGHPKYEGETITVEELEVLSSIEEITGKLEIGKIDDLDFISLRFLRNLTKITGVGVDDSICPLMISETPLESLDLKSLQRVELCVDIIENAKLCFADRVNWTTLTNGKIYLEKNKNSSDCVAASENCSSMCLPSQGCMGPGSDNCITCQDFRLIDGHCSNNCSTQDGFYEKPGIRGNRECRPCNEQCDGSCSGDGPEHCHKCKNVIHNKACVAKCPSQTYKDAEGICHQCNSLCNECTGNSSVLGQSGCNSCINKTIRYDNETTKGHCISSEDECNETYFKQFGRVQTFNNGETVMMICRRCHPECIGCSGPEPFNCLRCRNYRLKKSDEKEECINECPEWFIDDGKMENSTEMICIATEAAGIAAIVVPVIVVLFLIIVVGSVIFIVFYRKQRTKRLEEELLIDLIPSKAKPNMASLRLIKESELRRGNTIGSGAFGTVYKGIWIPEKENVKIPVAIKILQDNSNTSQNMELLDEARIMASVCHPNCVRILAVCMTAQMMLVTQLMPLGCLLDYVRKEKSNIGSRALLLWSVQIAKGMKYLEELGIVHRDLAARNVLVNNSNHVKITDFGLAKLLDYDKDEIHSEGGKMPIKWLALECIQHRIYTHKSDVWSYGVTLWEMFTYGSRPYENLQARQIPQALEKGERLPQPSICTLDVYMTLIKCWMLDVDSRPTFSDLVDEFTRMAADPGRFLVIPGDKLMRLPSQAPDARDLFRMMSLPVVDEPHLTIMSGEEYLRPSGLDFDCSDGLFSPTSSTCGRLMSIPEDVCYENSEMTDRRRVRQSSEEDPSAAAADGKASGKLDREFSRGGSQRYITDPCRAGDVDGKEDDKLSHNGSQIIRVDKDGYIPPQSFSTQPSYLELIHDPSDDQTPEPPQTPPQHYMDMSSVVVGISKDNLEYFDNESANLTNDLVTNDKLLAKKVNSDKTKTEELDYYNAASALTDSQTSYSRLPQTDL